jgi:hypothetical protein
LIFLTCTSDSDQKIIISGDQGGLSLLPYQIIDHADRDVVSLRSPRNNLFLNAVPDPKAPTLINGDRRDAGTWEEFKLAPFLGQINHRWFGRVAAAIEALPSGPLELAELKQWLQSTDPDILRIIIPIVFHGYDPCIIDQAISSLPERSLDGVLNIALQGDYWFAPAFDPLIRWLPDRAAARKLVVGRDLDSLAHRSISETPLGRAVARTRRGIAPGHDLAVMTSAHEDGPYIMEWVAHHRALGAENIFIYATDAADGSNALLDALADANFITWIRCENGAGVSRHAKAFTHYLSCLPQSLDYRWSMSIDIDEFVTLDSDRYQSIVGLLRDREEGGANAVALSRLNYLSGGQRKWGQQPLIERFTTRLPAVDRTVKFLFATRDFSGAFAAEPIPSPDVDCVYHTALGALHHWPGRRFAPSIGDLVFQNAWIGSYRVKSVDEMIWEAGKDGLAAVTREHLLSYIQDRARDPAVVDLRAGVHLPGLRRELASMRSIPAVAAAEASMLKTVTDRLNYLREQLRAEMAEDPILRGVAAHWLTPC